MDSPERSTRPPKRTGKRLREEAQKIVEALTDDFMREGLYQYKYDHLRYRFMDDSDFLDDPLVRSGILHAADSSGNGWRGPFGAYQMSILAIAETKRGETELRNLRTVLEAIHKFYRIEQHHDNGTTFQQVSNETKLDMSDVTRCFYYLEELNGVGLYLTDNPMPPLTSSSRFSDKEKEYRFQSVDRTFKYKEDAKNAAGLSIPHLLKRLAKARQKWVAPKVWSAGGTDVPPIYAELGTVGLGGVSDGQAEWVFHRVSRLLVGPGRKGRVELSRALAKTLEHLHVATHQGKGRLKIAKEKERNAMAVRITRLKRSARALAIGGGKPEGWFLRTPVEIVQD